MTSGRQVGWGQIGLGLGAAGLGVAAAALLARTTTSSGPPRAPGEPPTVRAGRRLNRAAGVLAAAVLADSAMEHDRGDFKNPAMFAPLAVSALTLVVSAHGLGDPHRGRHRVRHATYVVAAATGGVGTGFHLYNVLKRTGGLDWQNLFYGAPLGAPTAIALSGLLGAAAERVRGTPPGRTPTVLGRPAARLLAALAAVGLVGTTGEAGLLHFRGAFHNPFMLLPVSLPPVAAALTARAAFSPSRSRSRLARLWLRLTALMGFVGPAFHAYGVHRNMGGWSNWRQNLLNGPPLPAPPSFTGLALAGLAALDLLKDHPDA
ncbi:hypothetical protein SLNSH_03290 [Alsobacter soli]|uniref:Uncharacterized protein n=2 Tax=Alsobacter soli TaxID=2109933 RepID=A0A2T1HY24_9HYPH|nr:hypothetical protein SLNSH_03290 [Alsobacter soli]